MPRKPSPAVQRFLVLQQQLLAGKLTGKAAVAAGKEQAQIYAKLKPADHDAIIRGVYQAKRGDWEHVGGGCWTAGPCGGECDDQYANKKLGVEAIFDSPVWRHFSMPFRAESIEQLKRLPGVKFKKKYPVDEA